MSLEVFDALFGLCAKPGHRSFTQASPEVRPQQELPVAGYPGLNPQDPVLLGPILWQGGSDRRVRDRELGLKLEHHIGCVACPHMPNAKHGWCVFCGALGVGPRVRTPRKDTLGWKRNFWHCGWRCGHHLSE